jgi:cytochrome c peroxidase
MKRAVLAVLAAAGLVAQSTADELRSTARQLFGVIEAVAPGAADTPRAKLGQALFWDARLGADGRTACASCHAAADGSADRRALSPDARGKLTQRNSQPIFNSTLQPALRWTGDRRDAAAQAVGSLTGSMGFASLAAAEAHLAETGYAPLFRAAFPDTTEPLSAQHFGLAIEAYEQTLNTPAAFDRFLQGDTAALTPTQQRGLRTFIERGCAACHNGPLLGGESFQKFGVLRDYWVETGATKIDEGRYLNTRDPADRFVFRVPMLRNITRTAPYFHDGSVPDLGAVVQIMARLQLGVELSAVETADLVAFLGALEGRDPVNYRPPQELPVSR